MLKSLNKSLAILNYISSQKNASVTELAAYFEIDKSSVSKILSTLSKNHYVRKNPANMKYCVDWGALSLAYRYYENTGLLNEAYDSLLQLSAAVGSIVLLCAGINGQIVPLLSVNSPLNTVKKNHYTPGVPVPMHCTSFGKVLYAYSPDSKKADLLSECDFQSYTVNTLDKEQFINNSEIYKSQGYAVSDREFAENVSSVAVPVYTSGQNASYAIAVSGEHDLVSRNPFYHNNVAYPSRLNAVLYFLKKVSADLSYKLPQNLE